MTVLVKTHRSVKTRDWMHMCHVYSALAGLFNPEKRCNELPALELVVEYMR